MAQLWSVTTPSAAATSGRHGESTTRRRRAIPAAPRSSPTSPARWRPAPTSPTPRGRCGSSPGRRDWRCRKSTRGATLG